MLKSKLKLQNRKDKTMKISKVSFKASILEQMQKSVTLAQLA